MNKTKKRIINSVKRWSDNSGTCYRQGVHVTVDEYDKLIDILEAEKANPQNTFLNRLYLFTPIERKNNIIFFNLTQRDFFNKYLKAKLRDDNTYLIIDKN